MRDITEPLKSSASGGLVDQGDLKALVAACEEVLQGMERRSPTRREDFELKHAGSEIGAPFRRLESVLGRGKGGCLARRARLQDERFKQRWQKEPPLPGPLLQRRRGRRQPGNERRDVVDELAWERGSGRATIR